MMLRHAFMFLGLSVVVSLRRANCRHKYILLCSVAAQLLGGSADGERYEDVSVLALKQYIVIEQRELLNGCVTSLYCTRLISISAQLAYACSHYLTCQALGISNRHQQS
jgi:hypothetical protein